jgi:accessory gene regulator B
MFNQISEKITESMVKNGTICSDSKEVYFYGVQQGLCILLHIGTAVVVGFLLGTLWQILIFTTALVALRSYAGGYHTKTHQACYALFILIAIAVSLMIKYSFLHTFFYVGLMVLASIIIIAFSPVDCESKTLDDLEKKVYRKRAIIICVIQILTVALLLSFNLQNIAVCVIWSLVVISVKMMIAKIIAQRKQIPIHRKEV